MTIPAVIPHQVNLDSDEKSTIVNEDLQKGVIIFNTTENKFQGWNGTEWVNLNE